MIELVKIAVKSASRRKKRTFLTMLGIFIGIAAVVALVSLGQGLQETINENFEKVGADKIYVQAREMGFTGKDAPGQLTTHDVNVAEKAHGVKIAAGTLARAGKIEFNNLQRTRFLMSIPDDAQKAELIIKSNLMEAEKGRLVSHKDKGKVIIGVNLAEKEFKKEIRVGNKIVVEGKKFEVVGILKHTGDPGLDSAVFMPEEDIRELVNEPEAFSYIMVQSEKGINPDIVAERIEKAIRRDRHLDEGKEDFIVQSFSQLIETFGIILNVIQAVFIGIAAISLLVGGIGIMNTMYTSVLERTKDIGVMKAIGAKNSHILTLFLAESGLLGLAGGAVGVLIGVSISKLVELTVNYSFGPNTLNASFPLYLVIGALAFSFIVGAFSGALPAYRASKLNPVDALRYE